MAEFDLPTPDTGETITPASAASPGPHKACLRPFDNAMTGEQYAFGCDGCDQDIAEGLPELPKQSAKRIGLGDE